MRRAPRTSSDQQVSPTNGVHGPALPDDATVHFVLDLALRVGEVQMSSGAGAADVTATIIAVTSAYGLPHCEVDVIYTSITVCCHRGTDLAPVTSLRVVRSRGLDYTRLSGVERLVRLMTTGSISAKDAYAELDKITSAPHPYPRWVATLAWAAMAGAVAVTLGANLTTALLTGLVTALTDRVGRLLNRRALPFFFQQVVGGALATAATLGLHAAGLLGARPSLVVGSALVVLLSGLSLVSTAQDAITGYNVTAAGRTMEIALMSAGLIAGVALTLRSAVELGVVTSVVDPLPPIAGGVGVQLLAGAAVSAGFAVASYAQPRALLIAAAAGATGMAGYGLLTVAGANAIIASGGAAVVIGFGGALTSRRLRIPPLVVVVSGMTPLLPGWTTYRGLYQLTADTNLAGVSTLVYALGIGLALAGGAVLGEYLAQPVRTGLGRLERRLAGPRLSGPLRPTRRRLE
ncbi:threonine/serine exporter family protein [Goodfellowiella coeruleoviolacea]|uniref:threonine/serine ThrE exporter family protein n=1 Tax=Goodfellowiella coeruleoviolacea TaxID=334858 RepID=UPI0020A49F26|nr:threonine/serine exporter family protein [Goodfellowiella coeruleoviolacea]